MNLGGNKSCEASEDSLDSALAKAKTFGEVSSSEIEIFGRSFSRVNMFGRYTALEVHQVLNGTSVVYGKHPANGPLGGKTDENANRFMLEKNELFVPKEEKTLKEVLDALDLDYLELLISEHFPELRKLDYLEQQPNNAKKDNSKFIRDHAQVIYTQELNSLFEENDEIDFSESFSRLIKYLDSFGNKIPTKIIED